ncbi:Saccharopine dehydrogenase [NADP(+), L-glutamate-forming] [Trichoderma simmonsii]|uniref:Saccharopine dehydrogenase [NADP(+), L-glutamate-forming] n=1 Tax=Trichoderma simmonsii TaxID=1491479 RepID=A0A8G0PJD5_9HYPO|nr:Saccharopine dehydrogenase [NADP(+), L-glutamate-forming] [Trichoderma simmonsii]
MAPQRALLLGSGFVAKPTLDILAEAGVEVSVACRTLEKAKKLSQGVNLASAISLDVNDEKALDAAVAQHDLVISLIPYTYHAAVIKSAIRNKKHVVTTSYVSDAMMELDQQAKDAGITVMNEIGLDPGIDHLSAVDTINNVHAAGGKILTSTMRRTIAHEVLLVVGDPITPELDMTFEISTRSRGVLLALRNAATFWEDGKIVNVAGPELMATAKPYHIYPGYAFVAYPNRDSSIYKERYNIPEAQTIIRGTLRYAGFPEFIKVLVDTGFLNDTEQDAFKQPIPWKEATQKLLNAPSSSEADLVAAVSSKTTFKDAEEKARLISGLKWIGIFSDDNITPRGNPLDTLCATLEEKMQYEEGERDFVMLQHKFEIENKDGSRETRTSTLADYGAPIGSGGYLSMERLVGVPAGIAAKQVLDGTLSEKGVIAPMTAKINDPLIKELAKYGIGFKEKTIKHSA